MKCTCKIGHLGRGDNICEKHEMWAERLMMKFAKSMLKLMPVGSRETFPQGHQRFSSAPGCAVRLANLTVLKRR